MGVNAPLGRSGCAPILPLGISVSGLTLRIELVASRSSVPVLVEGAETVKYVRECHDSFIDGTIGVEDSGILDAEGDGSTRAGG